MTSDAERAKFIVEKVRLEDWSQGLGLIKFNRLNKKGRRLSFVQREKLRLRPQFRAHLTKRGMLLLRLGKLRPARQLYSHYRVTQM